jgi:iron(III) transport system ATP-binding protein
VPQGAFLVLLGPSGCGKTTLLRMLAGLEHPTGGVIRMGGAVAADPQTGTFKDAATRGVGLVFQSYALWPHMSVRGNVEWPLKVARWSAEKRRGRVEEVLEFLGILELSERYPAEISGGQQQRVAIARMLGPEPKLLLFDEPLSNLDAKLRVEMRAELLRIHRASGATSVYVTHDQVEAMTMATHIAVMKGGLVEQFGPPQEILARPKSAFVATFVGTPPGNLIQPEVANGRYRLGSVDLGPTHAGAGVSLLYNPADLHVSAGGAAGARGLTVEFVEATPMAGRAVVTGRYAGGRISAVADALPAVALGGPLTFTFPEAPAAVFGGDGQRLS